MLLVSAPARAQLFTLTKEQLVELTPQNPFGRFPDGRPKVPDELLERAKGLSAEEVWGVLPGKQYRNQYEDGFQILHPEKKLIGRVVTAQFMPARPDVDQVIRDRAKAKGIERWGNQTVIDMLQPGDVLVVDLFGKKEGGTMVGDNLFYYIQKATKGGGLIVDGSIRDLTGIADMSMPAYFRAVHPTPIGNATLTAINVPVRIGNVTVMPGDIAFGDREGIYFIPPQFMKEVLDKADETHIHDEWTRKKFDEDKYKSSDIYGSPRDPELKKEYQEYLKKRLAEIRGGK
ncbi:MAG: dimethylmenaquinone methyltransferase [Acidobacteria bacterium]|nr:dimethylmenaquinone methyltransferase [Acidobacteriota bacterium]